MYWGVEFDEIDGVSRKARGIREVHAAKRQVVLDKDAALIRTILRVGRRKDVVDDLGDDVALVLDGGDCEVGIESTIIDLSGPRARILRPGGLGIAAIRAVLDAVSGPGASGPPGARGPSSAATPVPRVPGDRRSHYAPVTRTVVVAAEGLDDEIRRRLRDGGHLAVWSVERPAAADEACAAASVVWRQRPVDPVHFARALYDGLRSLDREACDVIVVERPPDEPAWAAINDRLLRASAP